MFKFFDNTKFGVLPYRSTYGSAGYELIADNDYDLMPGAVTAIHTNVSVDLPTDWCGLIVGKSGRALKQGMLILGGLIDSDYKGELVILATTVIPAVTRIIKGEKAAQLIITPCYMVGHHNRAVRGHGGFGSTGL